MNVACLYYAQSKVDGGRNLSPPVLFPLAPSQSKPTPRLVPLRRKLESNFNLVKFMDNHSSFRLLAMAHTRWEMCIVYYNFHESKASCLLTMPLDSTYACVASIRTNYLPYKHELVLAIHRTCTKIQGHFASMLASTFSQRRSTSGCYALRLLGLLFSLGSSSLAPEYFKGLHPHPRTQRKAWEGIHFVFLTLRSHPRGSEMTSF